MKKISYLVFLGFAAILLGGAGCPQTSVNTNANIATQPPPGTEQSSDAPTGVIMENGKMKVQIGDGKSEMMTTDMMLSNGTKIMVDGKVMMKDGSTSMMKDGDSVDMQGKKTSGGMMKKDDDAGAQANTQSGNIFSIVGSYEDYAPEKIALAATNKVVLFFKADWCPTCRALDADINAHLSSIPTGTTILKVNYDASTELKKKYSVTYQHTFVQVDAQGNIITKWSGSQTLANLIAKIK